MGSRTLTRADLAEAVVRKIGLPRNESQELVELVLGEISLTLARGENVKLSSFGSFGVRDKGQRIGRNPKTGRGGAHHAAACAGVPSKQHHEGSHQQRTCTSASGGIGAEGLRRPVPRLGGGKLAAGSGVVSDEQIGGSIPHDQRGRR